MYILRYLLYFLQINDKNSFRIWIVQFEVIEIMTI